MEADVFDLFKTQLDNIAQIVYCAGIVVCFVLGYMSGRR